MKQVTMIVAGAGGRGYGFVDYARKHPDELKIVGVAEPRQFYRERVVNEHGIPAEHVFTDWKDMAKLAKFADCVAICTQDPMHADPAIAFAAKGYHMLLEKPMAPNEADCRRIVQAALDAKIIFAVCHSMRYTEYTQKLKELLDSGAIGEIVSVQHLEPVGYWHQAHSFVRGNWRNEAESSFMLLAKSCHDLDWLRYIVGQKCTRVASFGSLFHFRKDRKPAEAGAAMRCTDCPMESKCAYSAKKLYLGNLARGNAKWPVDVVAPVATEENVLKALREGPYGRCVYECDNDVVDHQVVSMNFAGGQTAVFTMTAFNQGSNRKTRIFGTKGEITGDGEKIWRFDFLTDKEQVIDTAGAVVDGHGGGDYWFEHRFVKAVATNDPSLVLSGPQETLESHLMVFAAERSRKEGKIVEVK